MECCNLFFHCNQIYCVGMVSVTSMSPYQSSLTVDPLGMTEVDSTELAGVRADCPRDRLFYPILTQLMDSYFCSPSNTVVYVVNRASRSF